MLKAALMDASAGGAKATARKSCRLFSSVEGPLRLMGASVRHRDQFIAKSLLPFETMKQGPGTSRLLLYRPLDYGKRHNYLLNMDTHKQDTVGARIGKALAERIISGLVEPGSRLRQDRIAEEFGASHVPVREAFRRLEAQGLVVSEPRRGVRVAGFSPAEVKEVAEMRAALEVLALRYAAPHLPTAILDQAESVCKAGDRAKDVQAWDQANRAFHKLILAPCAMPRLLKAIDDLHMASARFLFSGWRAEWEAPTDRDHRAILSALRAGNVELATTVLARHVQCAGHRPQS